MTDETFTLLCRQHMDMVYRLALSCTKNSADSDDITQNVLLKLYRYEGEFRSAQHLRYWLVRVTINECNSLLRLFHRRDEDIADYAEKLALPSEEHRDLLDAVMRLPKDQRIAVYLHYYEGYTTEEIGTMCNTPPATVRTRLARARRKLKSMLTEVEE